MGKGGLTREAGLASSSQVVEGRGTDGASKETRLFWQDSLGRVALTIPDSIPEDDEDVPLEEREEARTRDAIVIV